MTLEKHQQELIDALDEGRICDFIGSNYHLFSKEELKDVVIELACAVFDSRFDHDSDFEEESLSSMASSLQEAWDSDPD